MQYVTFEKLDNGNLKIVLIEHGVWDLREDCGWDEKKKTYKNLLALHEVLEYQLCNGWDWIEPERIGALTEAPIITDDLSEEEYRTDEYGYPAIKHIGKVWWYPQYEVFNSVEELLRDGYVIFTSESN